MSKYQQIANTHAEHQRNLISIWKIITLTL